MSIDPAVRRPQGQVHTVDDGALDFGAIWHLDLSASGAVEEQLEIAEGQAGFEGIVDLDTFGSSVTAIGDLDFNFTTDLAVGAPGDDTGGNGRGAVWILFRDADGSIASERALRSGDVPLADGDGFGSGLAFLGDLNGDLRPELAVGAPGHDVSGGVRILSLEPDGSVASRKLVAEGQSGFGGNLDSGDGFGASLAAIGDLDGDAVPDLAVGAPGDDDGGGNSGALWILFLNRSGTVKDELKISRTSGGFGSGALDADALGSSVSSLGDLDDDGVVDLALGAPGTGTTGGVWILFLNADGTVRAKQLISSSSGGLSNPTQQGLGAAVASLGDLDADGIEDLAVGAPDTGAGAVFALALNADGTVKAQWQLESSIVDLATGDRLGSSLTALGDVDGDGRTDLAVGARGRDGVFADADFLDLQTAVNAAANGDTLLVRNGTYEDTTVSAKALTILRDGAGTIRVSLQVENLAASQTVALHGLYGRLRLVDNAGLVWVEECAGQGTFWGSNSGLSVSDCARVVAVRSSSEGSADAGNWNMPPVAGAGVELTGGSTLHAYDCNFTGATGSVYWESGMKPDGFAQQGGPGLKASADSFVFLSRCTVNGADGRYYEHPSPSISWAICAGPGTGLVNAGEAIVLDSELNGGTSDFCGVGPDVTGPVQILPGEALSFTMSQLGREREDVTFTFQGPPFRAVHLLGSPNAQAQFLPVLRGSLLVGMPRATEFLGFTDSEGRLEVVRSIGLLPPSADIRRLYMQPFYFVPEPAARQVAPHGGAILGAGALYLVLDESF